MTVIITKGGISLKTFKMLSFQLEINGELKQFPLEDGILINQENSHQTWILEAFLPINERAIFDKLQAQEEVFDALVVISFPDNDPVLFRLIVDTIKEINNHVSVLMKGTLIRKKRKNSAEILQSLLEENPSPEQLVERFEAALKQKD